MELLQPTAINLSPSAKRACLEMSVIPFPLEADIPSSVSREWLFCKLGVSDKTLMQYREIAYETLGIYRRCANRRNPGVEEKLAEQEFELVILREKYKKLPAAIRNKMIAAAQKQFKKYRPDEPPFSRTEAQILIAIADLYKNHVKYKLAKRRKHIERYINNNKDFWRQYYVESNR